METHWKIIAGTKNQFPANFINGGLWVTLVIAQFSLTQQQPLRVHWALTVRSTVLSQRPTEISERPAATNGVHWVRPPFHITKTIERPLRDPNLARSLSSLQDQIKIVSMWNGSKNPWKIIERLKSNFPANFSEISVGPWRLPNVHWETNKTFERSLKDYLIYSLRSLRDQSRSLRDWSRPLREQLRSPRDLWENNWDLSDWETSEITNLADLTVVLQRSLNSFSVIFHANYGLSAIFM